MLAAARTVVVFGLLSQLAGFARLLVIAAYFGAGPLLDAYYLGLVIPAFVVGLSGGILLASVIPAYVDLQTHARAGVARDLRNATLTWCGLLLAVVAAASSAAPVLAVRWFWPAAAPAVRVQLEGAFALLAWSAPINGISDAVAMFLNAEGRFLAAASAPVINVVVSVAVLVLLRGQGMPALVCSLLCGIAAQAAVVLCAAHVRGIRWRPAWRASGAATGPLMRTVIPVLITSVLANFVLAFLQSMSARAGAGAVSAFGYATRLHYSLVQVFVMSISAVVLPHFARLVSRGSTAELRTTLQRMLAATTLFSAAALAFVWAAGPLAVSFLLQRGRFTAADGRLVATIWLALTWQLLGITWWVFLQRLFQAQRRPWLIAALSLFAAVTNVALTLVLLPAFGVTGVAVANTVAMFVLMVPAHFIAARAVGGLVDYVNLRFMTLALIAEGCACAAAYLWSALVGLQWPAVVIAGQLTVVLLAALAVARLAPLSISVRALLRAAP